LASLSLNTPIKDSPCFHFIDPIKKSSPQFITPNGNLLSISGNVGYRIQPYVNIDFSSTYNRIKLPSPWGNNNFLLLGPKLDVTFSNKLFLTTFFQYNEQTKNINFNTRFQWRYKPVSDLFIVYTDNYYIGPVFVKNRAVVLKFTYWWNK
jgi:hypothetical protein